MADNTTNEQQESRDESHDAADLDRAAAGVDEQLDDRGGDRDIPPSRRQRARERAETHLEGVEQNGLAGATRAVERARSEQQEHRQQLQRARKALETAEQMYEDAATVTRLLQSVVRERSYIDQTGRDLASTGEDRNQGDTEEVSDS